MNYERIKWIWGNSIEPNWPWDRWNCLKMCENRIHVTKIRNKVKKKNIFHFTKYFVKWKNHVTAVFFFFPGPFHPIFIFSGEKVNIPCKSWVMNSNFYSDALHIEYVDTGMGMCGRMERQYIATTQYTCKSGNFKNDCASILRTKNYYDKIPAIWSTCMCWFEFALHVKRIITISLSCVHRVIS